VPVFAASFRKRKEFNLNKILSILRDYNPFIDNNKNKLKILF
jgi:hypothetical protein